jgi:hypothetical protein
VIQAEDLWDAFKKFMKERNYKFTDKKSMLDSSFSTLADKKQ